MMVNNKPLNKALSLGGVSIGGIPLDYLRFPLQYDCIPTNRILKRGW